MRRVVLALLLLAMPGAASAQTTADEAAVREKSARIGAQIAALKAQLADEAAPTVPHGFAAGAETILTAALGRAPSVAERDAFVAAHPSITPKMDADWGALPKAWADAQADDLARAAAYEAFGVHAYCDLSQVLSADALAESFANDPVIAARCGTDGVAVVVRRSGLDAMRERADLTARWIGAAPMTDAEAAEIEAFLPDYLPGADADNARAWNLMLSQAVAIRRDWDRLGRTEAGRAQRSRAVAKVAELDASLFQKARRLRDELGRGELADTFARMNAINNVLLEGTLSQDCWGSFAC